jgi:hypothetical protein
MNREALIWMVVVHVTVTAFTGYYFYKVLFTKPKSEEELNDSED